MLENVNKISIIGGSGTGKTTLADNLGKVLNIPVYHIDGINYFNNWVERDKGERDKIILEKLKEEKWIIDGTYNSTLAQRLEKSDLVIYLDYSSFAQVKGVLGRYIKYHGKEKQEIPGCEERMTLKFFIWVLNWRKNKREKVLNEVKQINQSKVLIFKSRIQLNKWYKNQFNERINH